MKIGGDRQGAHEICGECVGWRSQKRGYDDGGSEKTNGILSIESEASKKTGRVVQKG
jgi:hypothetical protein